MTIRSGSRVAQPIELEPVHAGHSQIRHERVEALLAEEARGLRAAGRGDGLEAAVVERVRHHLAHRRDVVDDQHAGLRFTLRHGWLLESG